MIASPTALTDLDMQLGELSGIVDALLFLQEEGDSQRVRNATVALLYSASDKLGRANSAVGRLSRMQAVNVA